MPITVHDPSISSESLPEVQRAPKGDLHTQNNPTCARAVVQRLRAGSPPSTSNTHGVLALQRLIGNRATVQMLRRGGQEDKKASRDVAMKGVAGSGSALPWLDRIQSSIGPHDIRGVQAFSGEEAAAAATAIGAKAYTAGDRIAFAESSPSLFTAAHEAAHVVQQRNGVSLEGGVGKSGDPYEQQADAVANAIVRGESAEHLLGGGGARAENGGQPSIQREDLDSSDLALAFTMAEMHQQEFNSIVSDLAKRTGGNAVLRTEMKKMSRSVAKGREKLKENPHMTGQKAVASQTDILAGSVVYPNLNYFLNGWKELEGLLAKHGASIVRMKNRMHEPQLRDFLINFRMKSGFVAELQLHLTDTIAVKQGNPKETSLDPQGSIGGWKSYSGHDTYDYTRIIDAFMKEFESLPFAPEEKHHRNKTNHELRREASKIQQVGLNKKDKKGANSEMSEIKKIKKTITKRHLTKSFRATQKKLRDRYAEIQKELMDSAWQNVIAASTEGESFHKLLLGINDISGNDTGHDFKKMDLFITQGWSTNSNARTRIETATERLEHFTEHADEALKEVVSDDPLDRLKEYQKQLKDKHHEKMHKRKKHMAKDANMGQAFQRHSRLVQFMNDIMNAAIRALEKERRQQDEDSTNA